MTSTGQSCSDCCNSFQWNPCLTQQESNHYIFNSTNNLLSYANVLKKGTKACGEIMRSLQELEQSIALLQSSWNELKYIKAEVDYNDLGIENDVTASRYALVCPVNPVKQTTQDIMTEGSLVQ